MGASCSCASAIKNVHSHEKKDQLMDAPQKKKVYRDEQSSKSVTSSHVNNKKDPPKDAEEEKPKKTIDLHKKIETKETPKEQVVKQPSQPILRENIKKASETNLKANNEIVKQNSKPSEMIIESNIPKENTAIHVSEENHDLKKVDSVAFSFVKSLHALSKRYTFSPDVDKKEQDQIEILSSYLPQHLLYHLENSESSDLVTGTSYETCVLMIDISGFTPLTESLSKQPNGVELLTKYINAYFTGLIEYIYSYSGDIEKFAGDAIICQFCNKKGQNKSLKELILSAMECALSIQKNEKLRVFKVNESISLQIHCGISIGSITTHHIGGVSNYYLRISSGQALLEMGGALGNSKVGELCLTKDAYEVVKNDCTCKRVEGIDEEAYLAIDLANTSVETSSLEPVIITPKLSQAIKQFLSPSVRTKIMAGQQDWLNEIKPLSIGFLSIIDSNTYSSVLEANAAYQDYISLVQNILEKYEGFIANLLSDEKGTILVFCFGYPFTHTNDPLRAVKAGIEIREQLSDLGIQGGLGISTGKCFIGNVGSMYRKEFTIYGDKVNLSARLMKESEKYEGTVLCEEDTYSLLKGLKIELLDPIKVKGKSNMINICKVLNGELSSKQTYYNAKKSGAELVTENDNEERITLIGRENVFRAIDEIIEAKVKEFDDPNAQKQPSRVITIRGDVGFGKTDLLTRLSDNWKSKIAAVYVSPPQFETPFYTVHSNIKICFCEIVAKKKNIVLNYADVENVYKSLTLQEKEEVIAEKITEVSDITYLYLLNNVFGTKFKSNGELLSKEQIEDISTRIMCTFLVGCWVSMGYGNQPWFMLCDDYQYMDPFSRRLLTLFLETPPLTETMLMVFASRIMDNDSEIKDIEQKRLDFDIWSEKADLVVNLKPFLKEECERYLTEFFKASNVTPEALDYVYEKSQGNQLFTKMICTFLKDNHKSLIEDGTLRLKSSSLDAEILNSMSSYVQRKIDRLEDEAKIVLKIASVCGMEFDLNLVESVFPIDSPINREGNIEKLLKALYVADLLVKNGLQFKFRSSLVHSIVYNSVPKDQKREIHLKLANLFTEKIENEGVDEIDQNSFLQIASLHYSYYYDDIVLEEILTSDPLGKETELYNLCFAHHLIEKTLTMLDRQSHQVESVIEIGLAIIRIMENVVKNWKENSNTDYLNSPRLTKSITIRDFVKNTKELCTRRFQDLSMIDSSPYIFATSLVQMKEYLTRHLLNHSIYIQSLDMGDISLKNQAEELLRKGVKYCPPENRDLFFYLHGQMWFLKFLNDETDEALAFLPKLAEIASNNPNLMIFAEIAACFSNNTRGCFEQVGLHSKKVIEIYSQNPDQYSQHSIENFKHMDAFLLTVTFAMRALHAQGRFEEARQYFDSGAKRSMEVNHQPSLIYFLTFSCFYLLQSEQLEELKKVAEKGTQMLRALPHQQLFHKFYLAYVQFRSSLESEMSCQDKDHVLLSTVTKMESLYLSICHYSSPSLILNFAILECKLKYLELISAIIPSTKCPSIPAVISSFNDLMDKSLNSNQETLFGELWRLKGEMQLVQMKLKLDNVTQDTYQENIEQYYNEALKYVNNQHAHGLKFRILQSYLRSLKSLPNPPQSTIDSLTLELNQTYQLIEKPTTYPNKDVERYLSLQSPTF